MSLTPPRYSAKEFLDASDSGDSDRMTSHMLLQAAATETQFQQQARVLDRLREYLESGPKLVESDWRLRERRDILDLLIRLLREEGVTP